MTRLSQARRLAARLLLRSASLAGGAGAALADLLTAAARRTDEPVPCPLCARPTPSAEVWPVSGGIEEACSGCQRAAEEAESGSVEVVGLVVRVRTGAATRERSN